MLYLALRNSILLLVLSYFLIGCSANYTNKEDFFNTKSSSNQRLFFYDKEQSKKDFEELAKSILLMYETIGSFYFSKRMNLKRTRSHFSGSYRTVCKKQMIKDALWKSKECTHFKCKI